LEYVLLTAGESNTRASAVARNDGRFVVVACWALPRVFGVAPSSLSSMVMKFSWLLQKDTLEMDDEVTTLWWYGVCDTQQREGGRKSTVEGEGSSQGWSWCRHDSSSTLISCMSAVRNRQLLRASSRKETSCMNRCRERIKGEIRKSFQQE
jgi:hypothetical protein